MNRGELRMLWALIVMLSIVFVALVYTDSLVRMNRAVSTRQLNSIYEYILDDRRVVETIERQMTARTADRFTGRQGEALARFVGPRAVQVIQAATRP